MKFLIVSGSYRSGTTFLYKALNSSLEIKLLYQPFIQYFKYIDFEIRNNLNKKTFGNFPLGITKVKNKINLDKIILKKKKLIEITNNLINKNKKKILFKNSDQKLYLKLYEIILVNIKNYTYQFSSKDLVKIIFESLRTVFKGKKIKYVGFKEPFLGTLLDSLLSMNNTYIINLIRDPREILCSRNYYEKKSDDFRKKKHPVILISLICQRNMEIDEKLNNKKNYLSLNFNNIVNYKSKTQKKLNNFLKLKTNLNFIKNKKNKWKINSSSNSKNYGSNWKDKLELKEIAIIEKLCVKYFKKYNYKPYFKNNKKISSLVKIFSENKKEILKWTHQNVFLKYDKKEFKNL